MNLCWLFLLQRCQWCWSQLLTPARKKWSDLFNDAIFLRRKALSHGQLDFFWAFLFPSSLSIFKCLEEKSFFSSIESKCWPIGRPHPSRRNNGITAPNALEAGAVGEDVTNERDRAVWIIQLANDFFTLSKDDVAFGTEWIPLTVWLSNSSNVSNVAEQWAAVQKIRLHSWQSPCC